MKILMTGLSSHRAGIETFIYNYTSNFEKLEIDLLVFEDNIAFANSLLNKGYNIIKICGRKKNYYKHKKQLEKLFKRNDYDAVWMNVVNNSYILPLKLAKKNKVPMRILHAHSSQLMGSVPTKILHKINSKKLEEFVTDFWTCSSESAAWMFSNINQMKVKTVNNAIDLEKFIYSQSNRNNIREKIKLQGKYIVGHVGRLSTEKNHMRLIDIFHKGLKENPNSHLVLVGDGVERSSIEEYIEKMNIQEYVTMLGSINYIDELLSAFDVLVLPSLIEGLSVVLIEAQANGLRCIVSGEVVGKDAKLTESLQFINLSESDDIWASKIFENKFYERKNNSEVISKKGYNILFESKKLEMYLINRICDLKGN